MCCRWLAKFTMPFQKVSVYLIFLCCWQEGLCSPGCVIILAITRWEFPTWAKNLRYLALLQHDMAANPWAITNPTDCKFQGCWHFVHLLAFVPLQLCMILNRNTATLKNILTAACAWQAARHSEMPCPPPPKVHWVASESCQDVSDTKTNAITFIDLRNCQCSVWTNRLPQYHTHSSSSKVKMIENDWAVDHRAAFTSSGCRIHCWSRMACIPSRERRRRKEEEVIRKVVEQQLDVHLSLKDVNLK